MTDDLVTRAKTLSAMINLGERIAWGQDTAMIDDLAARIEADAATIARLEGERDNLSDKLELERALTDGAHRRAKLAETEAKRLDAALDNIATELTSVNTEPDNMQMAIHTAVSVARAAIAAAKGGNIDSEDRKGGE